MAQRIAVALQKGGTGKSTLSINVAAALTDRGAEVLMVDLDPHGAATEAVGLDEQYERDPPTLHSILVEREGSLSETIVATEWMDVVPASIDMTLSEDRLATRRRKAERLSLALEDVEDDYDVIIIDCPPNLGNLTDNALVACPQVVVPALAESPSIRAIELLRDQMRIIASEFETPTDLLAIVANRVEPTNQAARMIEQFGEYGVPVFEIRKRVALQDAYEAGEPLLAYEPGNDMNEVFGEIAEFLIEANREAVAV